MIKLCLICAHASRLVDDGRVYLTCELSQGKVERDLAQEMRKGDCGPDARLWESRPNDS